MALNELIKATDVSLLLTHLLRRWLRLAGAGREDRVTRARAAPAVRRGASLMRARIPPRLGEHLLTDPMHFIDNRVVNNASPRPNRPDVPRPKRSICRFRCAERVAAGVFRTAEP